ncbi:hypothetical protein AB3X94_37125 [Paraburkholderia sp. BR10923]|uniref:hypothetical protein n=1 Tax=Paraburkholderia sp. BR10923 TaxID=3236992 RepID=UPI0034CD3BE0
MASRLRRERVIASQQALANMPPEARREALRKARAEGRVYPTSEQRTNAKRTTRGR